MLKLIYHKAYEKEMESAVTVKDTIFCRIAFNMKSLWDLEYYFSLDWALYPVTLFVEYETMQKIKKSDL